jgi:hypothetical protein
MRKKEIHAEIHKLLFEQAVDQLTKQEHQDLVEEVWTDCQLYIEGIKETGEYEE